MMKKRILALAVSLLLLLGSIPAAVFAQGGTDSADYGTPGVDYVDGEVVACVKGGSLRLKAEIAAFRPSRLSTRKNSWMCLRRRTP